MSERETGPGIAGLIDPVDLTGQNNRLRCALANHYHLVNSLREQNRTLSTSANELRDRLRTADNTIARLKQDCNRLQRKLEREIQKAAAATLGTPVAEPPQVSEAEPKPKFLEAVMPPWLMEYRAIGVMA